jgi:DNA repair protein RecO (recombination protein O)
MIENTTGLVLRTRPLTETSLIVHWLTPDVGRIATVAKGARRPKSTFRGKLDLFYLADFSFARSRRSELHALREASLRSTRPRLRENLGLLHQACYAAALIEQSTETDTPLPEIYELMEDFLQNLSGQTAQPQMVFAFELKLLRELGLDALPEKGRLSPGAKEIINKIHENDFAWASRLRLDKGQSEELRQFLQGFLIFHLGRIPRNREAALQG